MVRRTTVITFTNKEDYIIASTKGGDVYRFDFFQLHLLTVLTLFPLDIFGKLIILLCHYQLTGFLFMMLTKKKNLS